MKGGSVGGKASPCSGLLRHSKNLGRISLVLLQRVEERETPTARLPEPTAGDRVEPWRIRRAMGESKIDSRGKGKKGRPPQTRSCSSLQGRQGRRARGRRGRVKFHRASGWWHHPFMLAQGRSCPSRSSSRSPFAFFSGRFFPSSGSEGRSRSRTHLSIDVRPS